MPRNADVPARQNLHRTRNARAIAALSECGWHARTIVVYFRDCSPETVAAFLGGVASLQRLASVRDVRRMGRRVEVTATLVPGTRLTTAAIDAVTDELVALADCSGFTLEGWDVVLPVSDQPTR